MLQLVRITDSLPDGFDALRAEADAEGHRHMSRLAVEMSSTPDMFTALLAAFEGGELVGIGGITPEPTDPSIQRLRRLFVARRARRLGVARTIANALLEEALQHAETVTVHAGNPGAARFWEAMGFTPDAGRAWSHSFRPAAH
jgi:GNAT superfamily N-acetyltransferase